MRISRRLWTLLGLLLVPLVVAGGFLWATWDYDSRLERVEAAVVNLDEPVRLNDQLVPLGWARRFPWAPWASDPPPAAGRARRGQPRRAGPAQRPAGPAGPPAGRRAGRRGGGGELPLDADRQRGRGRWAGRRSLRRR